jgi:hypothetical protein
LNHQLVELKRPSSRLKILVKKKTGLKTGIKNRKYLHREKPSTM